MTVLRLALSELKRMTGGVLPKLTIAALILVPLLYGAVYLYANWDPYNNLDGIKAALVLEDEGAATADGRQLEAGQKVADNLLASGSFDWVSVDSAADANDGVKTGQYGFALRIPKDFSRNLASPAGFDSAQQGIIDVTTNDANNYLLSNIVDKVTTQVHNTVAAEVGEETANRLLTGYGVIHQQMVKAADGAAQVAAGADTVDDGAGRLSDGTGALAAGADQLVAGQQKLVEGAGALGSGAADLGSGASRLSSGLGRLTSETSNLPVDTATLADGAAQVAAGNAQLNSKVQDVVGAAAELEDDAPSQLASTVDQLVKDPNNPLTREQADKILADYQAASSSGPVADARQKVQTAAAQVQQLADGSEQVSEGANHLAAATPALTSAISSAHDGAAQLSGGASRLAAGAATLEAGQRDARGGSSTLAAGAHRLDAGAKKLADGTGRLEHGAHTLADRIGAGAHEVPNPDTDQTKDLSQVIADPVGIKNVSQAEAGSYGAGLAPFFLALAMWIGIFMLMQAMRPITQRALASNAPAWKIAIGGWLPFFAVAVVQASSLYLAVRFGLGLETAHPVATWGLLLLAALAFTALIQGIVALLGTVGKFVVLILLVLQLVTAGGTFPWQTTPEPLHALHEILPMGYVVTGMRHLIYGIDLAALIPVVAALLLYTLVGALLAILAVHKHKTWTLKTLHPEIAV